MNLNELFYGWYAVVFDGEIVAVLPTKVEADIYRDSFYPNGEIHSLDVLVSK